MDDESRLWAIHESLQFKLASLSIIYVNLIIHKHVYRFNNSKLSFGVLPSIPTFSHTHTDTQEYTHTHTHTHTLKNRFGHDLKLKIKPFNIIYQFKISKTQTILIIFNIFNNITHHPIFSCKLTNSLINLEFSQSNWHEDFMNHLQPSHNIKFFKH
jgi:hypothetical protein